MGSFHLTSKESHKNEGVDKAREPNRRPHMYPSLDQAFI
jgi:hypothetical protein